MASTLFNPAEPIKRDWGAALQALRRLLADKNDTVQVFRITRALNGDSWQRNYRRLIASVDGGRLAYRRVELARRLSERSWVESFPEGSVGAAYRAFLHGTGYSAEGMIEVSDALDNYPSDIEHPYAWFRRRERDLHDVWHVLTGYKADEPLGEACVVAFTYGQTGGLGWAFLAAGLALRSLRTTGNAAFARAVWEGYRHGRRASWLHGEDYEALMDEPLDSARKRLGLDEPVRYRQAAARLASAGITGI